MELFLVNKEKSEENIFISYENFKELVFYLDEKIFESKEYDCSGGPTAEEILREIFNRLKLGVFPPKKETKNGE